MFFPDFFSRIGHMRGFGIQSPWAYSFVREVIAEEWPYYSYKEIDEKMVDAPKRMHKMVKLYFRIANRIQPETLVDLTPTADVVAPLIALGCKKIHPGTTSNSASGNNAIIRLWFEQTQNNTILSIIDQCSAGSMLFIEDINSSNEFRSRWKELCANEKVNIVFDLYDTGLVYIDRKMNKAVYKLNF